MKTINLKKEFNQYCISLKTQDLIKQYFNDEKLKEKLLKNRLIGLISLIIIFIIGVGILILGAFINKGNGANLNNGAITCVIIGIFFLLCLLIPYTIVANQNKKIMHKYIEYHFNEVNVGQLIKKISTFFQEFRLLTEGFLNFKQSNQVIDINYCNEKYSLIYSFQQKPQVWLIKSTNGNKISSKEWDLKGNYDLKIYELEKWNAGFSKFYLENNIESIAFQIESKLSTIINDFEELWIKGGGFLNEEY
ncbi:hypothetical protein WFS18_02885 [Ureaplasma parvum]|uniref:DUF3137 domain-containing protein n=3 Tax=Ureaplasma parvum TaxID=134821 RepID=A0AAC9T0Q2_UREPR|nr:hypothetical protein [Ureaplasma parvum]pir/E82892/ conserved hypothetical UU420 [imported] - Ureaplasma urealyticum [Ureaplasma urealyticum]AAF30831.1 conserved hypothetical [Ureaplasma parvum serovar 3 str. ATCC 700970]ACA33256.1 conserved hypothetical protein [Ureaplasma parvum serovar 3 str. ATCC 27815]ASD24918.1 hypothetical protein CEE64_00250 [Ureaplasma parvum]ASD28662.1 hypothetical protein CEG40_00295 [Ureaplasma parvum]ASD30086.1 hypothetical protein CEG42_02565 [Ureaplasma parv